MKECYFDPAMMKHMKRMEQVRKMQSRRLFISEHKAEIITLAAIAFACAANFFWSLI